MTQRSVFFFGELFPDGFFFVVHCRVVLVKISFC
jgi:hypothetical protein